MTQSSSPGTITRILMYPYDEVALRKPAAQVASVTPDVVAFAKDLSSWMRREDGMGLAATQVATTGHAPVPALFVMARGEEDVVFVNPAVENASGGVIAREGCLSFGSMTWKMAAPRTVTVRFLDLAGEPQRRTFIGFQARCVAHEIAHLQGKLMIDRMLRRDRVLFLEKLAQAHSEALAQSGTR